MAAKEQLISRGWERFLFAAFSLSLVLLSVNSYLEGEKAKKDFLSYRNLVDNCFLLDSTYRNENLSIFFKEGHCFLRNKNFPNLVELTGTDFSKLKISLVSNVNKMYNDYYLQYCKTITYKWDTKETFLLCSDSKSLVGANQIHVNYFGAKSKCNQC